MLGAISTEPDSISGKCSLGLGVGQGYIGTTDGAQSCLDTQAGLSPGMSLRPAVVWDEPGMKELW